jgi:hypothetical protein
LETANERASFSREKSVRARPRRRNQILASQASQREADFGKQIWASANQIGGALLSWDTSEQGYEGSCDPTVEEILSQLPPLFFFSQRPKFDLRISVRSRNVIAMPPHAARIPHAIWEQHKEEIITMYTSGDLPQTMAYMHGKYGFQATYSHPIPLSSGRHFAGT